jgi:hypothetical protein
LLTKIPLRNKEYELFDKYREKEEVEDIKIWDSTRIYNSGRISGATDKGIANKAHYLDTPGAR